MPALAPRPILSLGGSLFHYRPVIPVRLTGPRGDRATDGLLDSGSDETILQEHLAGSIGVDLTGVEERQVVLVGRPAPVRCRYASVQLQITDGLRETYEWTAIVASPLPASATTSWARAAACNSSTSSSAARTERSS